MDCNAARLLWPFALSSADLPADDRAEFEQHLMTCPSCAAQFRAEQAFDLRIGKSMRAVPVPSDLRSMIDDRVRVERRKALRIRVIQVSAAAACLLLVLTVVGWWSGRKITVSVESLTRQEDTYFVGMVEPGGVEAYFRAHGMNVVPPPGFDPALIAGYDTVLVDGHRAARLDFFRAQEARAKVYVLPKKHFRIEKAAGTFATGSQCSVEIVESGNLIYVIVYQGDATRKQFLNRSQQVG